MERRSVLDQETRPKFINVDPSRWGEHFLSVPIDESELSILTREIEVEKRKVSGMLMSCSPDNDAKKSKLKLIHLLVSLGLSYHFENEIKEILKLEFKNIDDILVNEDDLYLVSIIFRVFRSHGHYLSSDVFKRFKDDEGKFKEYLGGDVMGILSLYEAAHMRTKNDDILEDALSFTLKHLKQLSLPGNRDTPSVEPHVLSLIKNALFLPQIQNTTALTAREYISFYGKQEDHDLTLLEFSKLSFKFLQLHWIQELKLLNKWWKELDLNSKLPPFFRERILESWFCALISYFEPHYSVGRIVETKLIALFLLFDDACDEYGSVPEIETLVDCLERWDLNGMGDLKEYLQVILQVALNLFQELERDLKLQGKAYHFKEILEEFKISQRANLRQLKWARGYHVPHLDEYIEVGGTSITSYACIASSFVGMEEIDGKEAYEWLRSRPEIAQAVAAKIRLADDIMDIEEDKEKGYAANGINYYMKQYGVSEEVAIEEVLKIIEELNKTVNEEMLKKTDVSRQILMRIFNFGHFTSVFYTKDDDDAYNNRKGRFKGHIISLFEDM